MDQVLQQVQEPVEFYFRSGQVAKSVSDLLLILIDMGDEEFLDHVRKNEFAQWVDDVLHNQGLTEKVKGVQSKRELIQLLKENVQYRAQQAVASNVQPGAYTVVDFDVESGQVVRVPSAQKELEAWEKQFFEDTEKGLIPKEHVKEFIYGVAAGFMVGLIMGGVLYRVR